MKQEQPAQIPPLLPGTIFLTESPALPVVGMKINTLTPVEELERIGAQLGELTGNWQIKGLCTLAEDPDLFFPTKRSKEALKPLAAICMRCAVETECLEDALDKRIPHGYRGGMSEQVRKKLLKKRDATL